MCPTVRIDDEVYAKLQSQAVPFQDTPNSVLRRVLGLPEVSDTPSEASAEHLGSTRTVRRRPRKRQEGRKRAPKGSILSESEYEVPLLQTLIELGGSAPASDVISGLAPKLAGKLTALDIDALPSGRVRWHNRAQFARLNLVRSGDMEADAPRGIWTISQHGRARVQAVGEDRNRD